MLDNLLMKFNFETNTTKVKDIIPQIQNAILEGEIDAARAGIILRKYAKLHEEIYKGEMGEAVKDVVYEDTISHKEGNKATIELMGAKITAGAVRTWYDFEQCNDPLWSELERLEKIIKQLKKDREEELKMTIPSSSSLELGLVNKSILVPYELKISKKDFTNPKVAQITPPVKRQIDGLKYSV